MEYQGEAKWLNFALENFKDAVATGNIYLAKAVIADLLDKGFVDEARQCTLELRNTNTK